MAELTEEDIELLEKITERLENVERDDFLPPQAQHNLPGGAWLKQDGEPGIEMGNFQRFIDAGEIIEFSRPDVGVLFQYYGNYKAMVTTRYLLRLPNRRNLSDPELHEVECLLNKAGASLGIPMPKLPEPTEEDIKDVFYEIFKERIRQNPVKFYRDFTELMAIKGHPIELKQKDFKQFAANHLKN